MNEEDFAEDDESEFFFEKQTKIMPPPIVNSHLILPKKANAEIPVRNNSTNFVDIEPIENSLNRKYTFENIRRRFVQPICARRRARRRRIAGQNL